MVIICCLLLLIAGGFWLEHSARFESIKHALQSQTVPTAILNYGAMGKILKQLAIISAVPNDYSRFSASVQGREVDIHANIFQKKRQVGQYLYCANQGGMEEFPSSQVIKSEYFRAGWPLISVVTDEANLYDPNTGIISNSRKRGQEWERLAYVSYYKDKKLVFASAAGLRKHGGDSRGRRKRAHFRLYFRKDYGTNQFGPGILFSRESEPLKRLVIHNSDRSSFIECLAFDIAQQIGCVVPESQPVMFFLNGKNQGTFYFLAEHLSRRQWVSHFGHDNFAFYRYKAQSDQETLKHFSKLVRWARNPNIKMTIEEVSKHIDIEKFTRHLIAISFCGTTDGYQGAATLDTSKPDMKWSWVAWDMDHSFIDLYRKKMARVNNTDINREPWQQEGLELAFKETNFIRSLLFNRLMVDSNEYRRYFVGLMTDIINHRINAEFLNSRIEYYEKLASSYQPGKKRSFDDHRIFMKHRPGVLREQMQRYFGLGEVLSCQVKGPAGTHYQIDGYPEGPGYQGSYFKGTIIKVDIASEHQALFSHWLVNGEKVEHRNLTVQILLDTTIEAVFK